jgi:nicotinate-nucleotide adenylyltransferase
VKIGLYGGTFDPIHNAHLLIAQYIKDELGLNRIIFIPSSVPPHKKNISPSHLRFRMVEAAISDNPDFECSGIEIDREGKSFSFDTLSTIKDMYQLNKEQLFWIIGSDNLIDFHNWYKPEKIISICTVVVYPRKKNESEFEQNIFLPRVLYLKNAPLLEISSSELRSRVKIGRSIKYFVPPVVEKIISSEKLYS